MILRSGMLPVLMLLLDHNADPNINITTCEITPLYAAAEFGHLEVTQLLLDQGALRNQRVAKGFKALDIAVDKDHWEIVDKVFNPSNRELMRSGCKVGKIGSSQLTLRLDQKLSNFINAGLNSKGET